jgi:hypothetical protein
MRLSHQTLIDNGISLSQIKIEENTEKKVNTDRSDFDDNPKFKGKFKRINTIMHSVYIQANQVGFCSFHFYPPEMGGSYVSFANVPNTSSWTTDDGVRFPDKKHFENVIYNKLERTF